MKMCASSPVFFAFLRVRALFAHSTQKGTALKQMNGAGLTLAFIAFGQILNIYPKNI
jgi:hypothetical protein